MIRSSIWAAGLLVAAIPVGGACVELGSARTPEGEVAVEGAFASVHMTTHGMT